MTRPPSILARVISASTERLASALHVPPAAQPAFRDTVESILHGQWASMFGGEEVRLRLYVSRESQREREARRQRIVAALRAGEAARSIARRENVSPSWVRRLAKGTAAGVERSSPKS